MASLESGNPPPARAWRLPRVTLQAFLQQWGFPLFVLVVLVLGRKVLLPFVFAGLIAYILSPVVAWMSTRGDGSLRMPRALAIVLCYVVFLAAIVGFMFLLVPRLSTDVARIGKEAPALYQRINEEWTPAAAAWLEQRFPGLAPKSEAPPIPPTPLGEPHALLTITPVPNSDAYAVALAEGGLTISPVGNGAFRIERMTTLPEPPHLEAKLRRIVSDGLIGLQGKADDAMRLGQSVVAGLVKGVFTFFLTLMIGAFILIDREKLHSFLRSLFPPKFRADYDVIIAGIDRGLSGVIRGQLLICLVNAILTYIGLLIFDVKYALILAVVAGVMSLIPIFGSILSTLPIVLAALVSGAHGIDLMRGIAMTLWIIGIHFIEANLLNPKIIGTAAKIHPVLVIFSLVLGEHSYGLVGALLAVPVLSSIQVVFLFLHHKSWLAHGEGRKPEPAGPPSTDAPPVAPPAIPGAS